MRRLVTLLFMISACSEGDTGPGSLMNGSPDASPNGPSNPPPDGAVAPPPSGTWVTGYYVSYQRDLLPVANIDWSGLTHIAYGRVVPNADGSLDLSFDGDSAGEAHGTEISTAAHAHQRKAIVFLGGAGAHDGFAGAASAGTRATFVANLVSWAQGHGFDGFDLDWEPLETTDQADFLALAQALRAAWPSAILTLPIGMLNINYEDADPWYATVAPLLDQINLMAYGMGDNWGTGWKSWHSSPIYGESPSTPLSIDSTIAKYLTIHVPAAKLGIGIGGYGTCWPSPITGPNQALTSSDEHVIASDNVMSYTNIMAKYYSASARQWDDVAKVPYLSIPSPTQNPACAFVSYDDPQAIMEKGNYVKAKKLGGTIIWTINQAPALLSATATGFLQ
jgi:chitinase